MNDEPFQLCNDPPPHRPRKPEPRERQKQKTLFAGLDCLPDQQDLFPTDGEVASESSVVVRVVQVDGKTLWDAPTYKIWRSDGYWWCGKKRGWLPALRSNVRYHWRCKDRVDAECAATVLCCGTDYKYVWLDEFTASGERTLSRGANR